MDRPNHAPNLFARAVDLAVSHRLVILFTLQASESALPARAEGRGGGVVGGAGHARGGAGGGGGGGGVGGGGGGGGGGA